MCSEFPQENVSPWLTACVRPPSCPPHHPSALLLLSSGLDTGVTPVDTAETEVNTRSQIQCLLQPK